MMSKKFVQDFVVIENTPLNSTNFLIKVQSKLRLPKMYPGQFANLEINKSKDVFLRRPFSIFEVDYSNNSISFIIKILGRGSKILTELEVGELINIIYPLGKNFTLPEIDDHVLLIGGGSGVAPMLYLAKESGLNSNQVNILLGAKTKDDHITVDNYLKYANMHFASEDGSLGEKGFVTEHSIFRNHLKDFKKIYACGPEGMMKAVAKEAKNAGIYCEVSLENLMACGFGVCLCCIEPTNRGNLCVCTEGPVFNINELQW